MSTATMAKQKKLSREQLRQLGEIERQNYYTDKLDDETYEYPLFSGKQAVLSQRRSGYRTSAKAARELIDNSLEAGAKNIWVLFDRPDADTRGKYERPNKVAAIAFIDDGPGMTAKMARYALTWGGGTHHEVEKILKGDVEGRQINHIFGEGVSPRLRKMRSGMEAVGLPPDKLLQHGTPRIVYGVALTQQFREILLGQRTNRPRYILPFEDSAVATGRIAAYWTKRWLARRIERDEVLAAVEGHTLVYPVTHGARVELPVIPSDEPTLFNLLGKEG